MEDGAVPVKSMDAALKPHTSDRRCPDQLDEFRVVSSALHVDAVCS